MNANEMTPNCAIENATPLDLAITPVAAAVPDPKITRAAVPTNSAANFREKATSAIDPPTTPRHTGAVSLTSFKGGTKCGRGVVRLYRTMFRRVSARVTPVSIGPTALTSPSPKLARSGASPRGTPTGSFTAPPARLGSFTAQHPDWDLHRAALRPAGPPRGTVRQRASDRPTATG